MTEEEKPRFCFVSMEVRDLEGRLLRRVFAHAGQIWHIGPGGEEW